MCCTFAMDHKFIHISYFLLFPRAISYFLLGFGILGAWGFSVELFCFLFLCLV